MVDYKMKAGTGHFKVSGQNVQLVRAAAIKLVENNWPLIVFYFVVNVAGIGGHILLRSGMQYSSLLWWHL
jgi:hypothetical protein